MLDLFLKARTVAARAESVLETARNIAGKHEGIGFAPARKAGSGEQFWQYRGYLRDDPRRMIDWRASARSDAPVIRQKEKDIPDHLSFWCDTSSGMSVRYAKNRHTKKDIAILILLSLAHLMIRHHGAVFSIGNTDKIPARSAAKLQDIAHALIQDKDKNTLYTLSQSKLPNDGILILASDFLSPIEDVHDTLNMISKRAPQCEILCLQILDPNELDLPYAGRAVFDHDGQEEQIEDVEDVQNAYHDKMQTHIKRIQSICDTRGISYYHLLTDCDLDQALRNIVHDINQRRTA